MSDDVISKMSERDQIFNAEINNYHSNNKKLQKWSEVLEPC